jgi:hypothetical protein
MSMMHPEALTEPGKEIFTRLGAFDDFYLAGGTALALQIGHRLSIDFDLFTPEEISPMLLAKVKRIFTGSSVTVLVNDPGERTVFVNGVKMTFLCRGRRAPRGAARAQAPRSAARRVPVSGCAASSRQSLAAASVESEGPQSPLSRRVSFPVKRIECNPTQLNHLGE